MIPIKVSRSQKSKVMLFILTSGLVCALVLAVTAIRVLAVFPSQATAIQESGYINASLVDIQFSSEVLAPQLTGQDYFVNYRLEREKFRQQTKEMLVLLLDSPVQETQTLAQKQWLSLSQSIQQESEIENSLKIRGFADVVSQVKTGSVDVIILSPSLTDEQKADIREVVIRITGISPKNINIIARN